MSVKSIRQISLVFETASAAVATSASWRDLHAQYLDVVSAEDAELLRKIKKQDAKCAHEVLMSLPLFLSGDANMQRIHRLLVCINLMTSSIIQFIVVIKKYPTHDAKALIRPIEEMVDFYRIKNRMLAEALGTGRQDVRDGRKEIELIEQCLLEMKKN